MFILMIVIGAIALAAIEVTQALFAVKPEASPAPIQLPSPAAISAPAEEKKEEKKPEVKTDKPVDKSKDKKTK